MLCRLCWPGSFCQVQEQVNRTRLGTCWALEQGNDRSGWKGKETDGGSFVGAHVGMPSKNAGLNLTDALAAFLLELIFWSWVSYS